MAETMKILADNYIIGILLSCVIVISIYVFISIRIMSFARKQHIDVCTSAFVPIVSAGILIKALVKRRKDNATLKENEEISL